MAIKPTSFHKKVRKPLPEYEILTEEEREVMASGACCVCDSPGGMCTPENPTGPGSLTTSAAAQAFAYWVGR